MRAANRPLCRVPDSLPTHSVPVTAVPDAVLLERFAAGDEAALDDLFRRYRVVTYRVACQLLGHEADALDAVQDGFVNALRNLDQFRGQSSFKTWLLRVVSNAAFDLGRRRKRNSRVSHEHIDHPLDQLRASGSPPLDSGLVRAELRQWIDTALAQLSGPQRQTFVLHTEGELSYQEIADALHISIGTVMSRLFYARQKLRRLLTDQT